MQTILLLHGWSQNPDCFNSIKPSLEKKYRIITPIMPGFGKTKLDTPYDLDKYADWLKNFISKNKLTNLTLLGHSFGGSVCIKFLSKYPNEKMKLILVDAAIVQNKHSLRKKIHYFLIYIIKKIDDSIIKRTFQKVTYLNLIQEAAKIKNKTLIIWGNRDIVTPLKSGKIINKNIKNSTIRVISNSGHFPFIDKPAIFISHINQFLI